MASGMGPPGAGSGKEGQWGGANAIWPGKRGGCALPQSQRFHLVKEVADRAGECWVAAETKLGEELQRTPKATGTRGQLSGRKGGGHSHGSVAGEAVLEPPASDTPTDAERGIGKRQGARARKLAELGLPSEEACTRHRGATIRAHACAYGRLTLSSVLVLNLQT